MCSISFVDASILQLPARYRLSFRVIEQYAKKISLRVDLCRLVVTAKAILIDEISKYSSGLLYCSSELGYLFTYLFKYHFVCPRHLSGEKSEIAKIEQFFYSFQLTLFDNNSCCEIVKYIPVIRPLCEKHLN